MEQTTPEPMGVPAAQSGPRGAWQRIRTRILAGLLLVLPVLITLWVIHWFYTTLNHHVIEPLGQVVLWKVLRLQPDAELSYWFTEFAAPVLAILMILMLLYLIGFFAKTRFQGAMDYLLLRVPLVSIVYKNVRKLFQTLDRQTGQKAPQRVVLVPFPHPGMKTPAFVTATCHDVKTRKVLLCVYVPTTPVPTSGYFLLVPEEDVCELNWTADETLQAIISGGLTAPPEVSYFR